MSTWSILDSMPLTRRSIGILELLISGAAFGLLGIFGKWAYSLGMSPGELLSLRFVFAAAVMLAILVFSRQQLKIGWPKTLVCSGLGIFGYAVFASCYFEALKGISASLTVLLLYIYPVFVALGSRVWFGERMSSSAKIALVLASLGLALLVWGDISVSHWHAVAFGIGSALFYSGYILVSSRSLGAVAPTVSAFYIQLFAGIALSAAYLHRWDRVTELVHLAWQPLLGISLLSTVVAMALFLSGLQKVSASEASILSSAEPLTAVAAAAWFLNEQMSGTQWIGSLFVLCAFVLVSKGRSVSACLTSAT